MNEEELRAAMGEYAYNEYLRENATLTPDQTPPTRRTEPLDYDDVIALRRINGDPRSD